jgi:hypothetical protein
MSKTIKFIINPKGDIKIADVCGAPGRACLDVTKDWEKLLGNALEDTREMTEDDPEVQLVQHQRA